MKRVYSVSMLIGGLLVTVLLMLLLPFIPVIQAVRQKSEYAPLRVNLTYTKDPRAIAKAFLHYFQDAFGTEQLPEGKILESKKLGKLEVVGDSFDKRRYSTMVYIAKEATIPPKTSFKHEVISESPLVFGPRCRVRVIKTTKKLTLGRECCITRWIDVEGEMHVGEESYINIASCTSVMYLSSGVAFNRLWGFPVITARAFPFRKSLSEMREAHLDKAKIDENVFYAHKDYVVEAGRTVYQPTLVHGALRIEAGAKIFGNIKVHGDVVVEEGCFVDGDIISERSITIGENCFVAGNLFSRESILIHSYSQIGTPEHTKSVVAKHGIRLASHVAVFNYLLTDGEGSVLG